MIVHQFIGIDVSKEKFDVCLLKETVSSLQRVFTNNELGFKEFEEWIKSTSTNAKRFNEALQPFVNRLQKNGLSPKAIVGALMRKLVHIIFGMLKNNAMFNPELV